MKRLFIPVTLVAALATPSYAQDDGEGLSLMERGARMFMEGIMKEMEPAIDNLGELAEEFGPAMRSFAETMGPALRDLMGQVEDWSVYDAPEILPNGDIIIRRKPEAPEYLPKEGEVEI
ncbi:hypothetical protein [Pseudosulfitobacter pseudonitzschiae]|uniref:hypothetical protein n=1 Tax=Pseudosulfitobacter pseudonitzschiae TaxID=1402135 RepID=UPI001AFA622B|nr:hypothetical protein [Pseudosulfitobacter pseudonitzschiae]MBM1815273.1 hypothetical protein [Pseudosulfitobacter pseudonitzschiae]MBM1832264.1 hypothetical protein [Pseudosulfitobacter pseudonitzschiae]MBM1837132.1 hypothetical protein [Pseudosulfitobacter pseudonitzschiae]MBM1841978.1 hypothetical protein [Pseudosulfitobacter pseudonitzschiae]MBM1846846.1 hypothetical protein [Pseudosulfitobacter pseudonitzschiae]